MFRYDIPEICAVCGLDTGICECPECPECSEFGNPNCKINRDVITDGDALARAIGCPRERIGKALFKGTECGIGFQDNPDHVAVCGYAEGADTECAPHILRYPFKIAEFWDAVQAADDEGCELWHEWNGEQ